MTSTKVELSANKIARITDASDLAELLFPSNRNQQHAFLAIWITLKWADRGMVPNLDDIARQHDISRRTLERVRAKLRRIGLIDHVSRFNASHGYREGWILSSRFERSLRQLADRVAELSRPDSGSCEKDELLLNLACARRDIALRQSQSKPAAVPTFHQRGEHP